MIALFDLDDTLTNIAHRLKIAGTPPEDKQEFQQWLDILQKVEHIEQDMPIYEMRTLTHLFDKAGHEIIYLTGRHEGLREVTENWLRRHSFPDGPLYMREEGDWRKAGVFKGDVLKKIKERFRQGGIAFDDDFGGDTSKVYIEHGFLHLKVMK